MSLIRRLFLHSPKVYIAAVIFDLVLCFLRLLVRGFDRLIFYYDALTLAGAAGIFLGLLMLMARLGALDIFGYAFSMFRGGGSDASLRRDRDLYSYRNRKAAERSRKELTFMPFITVGVVFLLAGIILWSLF